MLGLLLIILIIYLLYPFKDKKNRNKTLEKCPPHKWIYAKQDEENGYLVCDRCKSLPGGYNEESG